MTNETLPQLIREGELWLCHERVKASLESPPLVFYTNREIVSLLMSPVKVSEHDVDYQIAVALIFETLAEVEFTVICLHAALYLTMLPLPHNVSQLSSCS